MRRAKGACQEKHEWWRHQKDAANHETIATCQQVVGQLACDERAGQVSDSLTENDDADCERDLLASHELWDDRRALTVRRALENRDERRQNADWQEVGCDSQARDEDAEEQADRAEGTTAVLSEYFQVEHEAHCQATRNIENPENEESVPQLRLLSASF